MLDEPLTSTPKADGFFMPAEFSPQRRVFMMWPERSDSWRDNAVHAQRAYADVANAICTFEEVVMFASREQHERCRSILDSRIRMEELIYGDAWARDIGPTFLINGKGELRAVDWQFNAWGGEFDGIYQDWADDDKAARRFCEIAGAPRYRTEDFVLEGGSIHTDGEGTVLTTEMCLLSPGRNPRLTKAQIETKLCEYLGCEKVLWLKNGIDPDETNGHVDDVACFVAPGEVACLYTDDPKDAFYAVAQENYKALCGMRDAKGRTLKVHKICGTKRPVLLPPDYQIQLREGTKLRSAGELCIASYLNFLIVNNAVIVPQYEDENDTLALAQIAKIFHGRRVVGIKTKEIVYGGGNIHCITQQQPRI
ncbi:MAG: agmatine deiminase [Oscillospiraceae bacterium]|jgi:agmatine deiminase|nr:agmatine deiminase [Oscillospiraceae bacterium]